MLSPLLVSTANMLSGQGGTPACQGVTPTSIPTPQATSLGHRVCSHCCGSITPFTCYSAF